MKVNVSVSLKEMSLKIAVDTLVIITGYQSHLCMKNRDMESLPVKSINGITSTNYKPIIESV